MNERRPDSTAGDDKVVLLAHASDSLDDFRFIVRDDLDPLQVYAHREAVLCEKRGIGVDGLLILVSCFPREFSLHPIRFQHRKRTLPPSTSSPMIRHAAV